jgi:hypothetical protein
MYINIKSKSAISFKEFKEKMNEHHHFENEWGFYVDIEYNKLFLIQNSKQNNNKNEKTIYSRLFNKYFIVICIGLSIFVLMLI